MIRFRNGGSNPDTQIKIMEVLFRCFPCGDAFSLDDMVRVLSKANLLSSKGFTGEQAQSLGYNQDRSKDSPMNNCKLYAEFFRMLGWVAPISTKQSYPLTITCLGELIADNTCDRKPLYTQCLMGLVSLTETANKVKYTEDCRPLMSILKYIQHLAYITNKEMCMGPLCQDDKKSKFFSQRCDQILSMRKSKNTEREYNSFAKSIQMTPDSVRNCTRVPIAALKYVGYIESKGRKGYYITSEGEEMLSAVEGMRDIRLREFNKFSRKKQESLIRLGFYGLLERAEYDISKVYDIIERDKKLCEDILQGKELLFSPYQTLRKETVDKALGISPTIGSSPKPVSLFSPAKSHEKHITVPISEDFCVPEVKFIGTSETIIINDIKNRGKFQTLEEIVIGIKQEKQSCDKDDFYPFVCSLFRIMGFPCEKSRDGDNGNRWDALITTETRNVPIEIKSPRESKVLTMKAVRQALENKIVLLSRAPESTSESISSLSICYELPRERSEIQQLVDEIYDTFHYKIGIVDIGTLLRIVASIVLKGKGLSAKQIYNLKGILYAHV